MALSPTASRRLTIALSSAAVLVLVVTAASRGCTGVGLPTRYRTETGPFASGSVEGTLVLTSSANAAAAAAPGCDPVRIGAVVWIDGPQGGAAPRSSGPELDLDARCGFDPPIAIAMADTTLHVSAPDTDHRMQAWLEGVRVFDAAEGGDANIRLVSPGAWKIRCAAGHPHEEAWVVVTTNPYGHVVGARPKGERSGTFRFTLEAVPVGRWTVVAWHPSLGERRTPVEVAAKGTTSVELEY